MDFNERKDHTTSNAATMSFPHKERCRVLIVGCGNSRLGEDMMRDGWFGGITNVDFSSVVIEQMEERYNDSLYRKIHNEHKRRQKQSEEFPGLTHDEHRIPRMIFKCADVTEGLSYSDESFDLILCKGTLDSLLCSSGAELKSKQMMKECNRLLDRNHGILFVVSHGAPDNRLVHFENEGHEWWHKVDIHKVPKRRQGNALVEGGNYSK